MPRPKIDRAGEVAPDDDSTAGSSARRDVSAASTVDVAPAETASAGRKLVRFGLFIAVALGLQAGPIAIQVLDLDVPLRGWRMFRGKGRDICDVRFTERTADGRKSRLTVEQVVEAGGRWTSGSGAFRLGGVGEIRAVARRYCARSSGGELLAVARCGHREKGWTRVLNGSEDLCRRAE